MQTLLYAAGQAQNDLNTVRDGSNEQGLKKLAEQVEESVVDKGYYSNASRARVA